MTERMTKTVLPLKEQLIKKQPLVHCITNPISINDCANGLLAVGARPIMAEHPAEVAGITASAKALMINLGNITDVRMSSMLIAGTQAYQDEIPCLIDLVGVLSRETFLRFWPSAVAAPTPPASMPVRRINSVRTTWRIASASSMIWRCEPMQSF